MEAIERKLLPHEGWCMKCAKNSTSHASGVCQACRTKNCKDCGGSYVANKGRDRCTDCQKAFDTGRKD